jgi:capsular polysaccharide transport system permease protein
MPEAPDAWADVIQIAELSRPSRVGARATPLPLPAPRRFWRMAARFLLLVVLPTTLAGTYFTMVAAERYVTEARFLVRKPNAPAPTPGMDLSLAEGPKGIGSDDAYAVRDFLLSRDAMQLVLDKAGLRADLTLGAHDPLWRFPGPLTGRSDEDLYRLYQSLVSVDYESSTGLTTLRVQAFNPEDAQRIAATLMTGGEALLNRLNDRARSDALRVAETEVARSRDRARQALAAVTAFRRREAVVDPTQLAQTVLSTIGALSLQLVEASTQLDMTQQSSPNSPQLAPLRSRIRALQRQIDHERGTLAGGDHSYAPRIAEYERLSLEREFAEKSFISALSLQEMAQLDASRQQDYLERVVTPQVSDEAAYPRRLRWTGSIFLAGLAVFWLFRPPATPAAKARRRTPRYA